MRTAHVVLTLAAVSLLLASCMQQPDVAAIRKTVDEFNAASTEAMMSGKTEPIMMYYEENAMSMPPNYEMLKGRQAIKGWMDQMMQSGMKLNAVKFSTVELDAGGKIAYEIGGYEMTITMPPMAEMKDHGKYVGIWKQQDDGSWKVHAEIWNTSMPMPPMDEMGKKEEKGQKKM